MKHILRVLIEDKGFKPILDTNCGCCDGCWSRFAQAVIYVKCTSGVGDLNVCLPMGAIFSSEPYKSYGLKEWATMPELELATLLQPMSCWGGFNTQYLRPYLFHLHSIRQKHPTGRVPDVLDLMQVYGFQSKSAFFYRRRRFRNPSRRRDRSARKKNQNLCLTAQPMERR
jgi:hypothetical protein